MESQDPLTMAPDREAQTDAVALQTSQLLTSLSSTLRSQFGDKIHMTSQTSPTPHILAFPPAPVCQVVAVNDFDHSLKPPSKSSISQFLSCLHRS